MEKTMEKIVALAKDAALFIRVLRFMVDWQIHGTTEILVSS